MKENAMNRFLIFCPKCKTQFEWDCYGSPFRESTSCNMCGSRFVVVGHGKTKGSKINRILKELKIDEDEVLDSL
jgi:hypothetical protein